MKQDVFEPLPENESLVAAWPTANQYLFDQPALFFARTRANPEYGRPGWTRECGKRFHQGCDIAPMKMTATGRTTVVLFTNCATGEEYESTEPEFIPHDAVCSACAGEACDVCGDENRSDFGIHVLLQHRWPAGGRAFYTLYAHLDSVSIREFDPVRPGQVIGSMGQTSRRPDARNWMRVAPHLHFEVWNAQRNPYNPEEFLRRFLRPTG